MADTTTVIEQAYSAFNKRDINGALAQMTEDVSWPRASEGGKVVGKEEIRAYWTRQWAEFDPHVEPLSITGEDGSNVRVRVHQIVKSLQGDILSDSEVLHIFTMKGGLIAAMDLGDETDFDRWPIFRIRTLSLTGHPASNNRSCPENTPLESRQTLGSL